MSENVACSYTPIHQWTHDGDEVLIVKCVQPGGESSRGFVWPKSGEVTTPNWSTEPNCESGGLFGWPWGLNIGGGKEPDYQGDWIVFAADPASVVDLDDKAKAGPTAEVVFYGHWSEALRFTQAGRDAWLEHRFAAARAQAATARGKKVSDEVRGAATASGDRGAATASGYSGAATASGYSGAATASGDRGAATASGYSGAATASGYSGAATASGDRGAAVCTGELATIEVSGQGGAGLVTADEFYWIIRRGAVLLHRWPDGHALLLAGEHADGTKVRVVRGEIVEVISVPELSQDGSRAPAEEVGPAGHEGSREASHGGGQDRAAVAPSEGGAS
jgi:hypothetical protein